MKTYHLVSALLFLAPLSNGVAMAAVEPAAKPNDPQADDPNKKICRRLESSTGSIMPKRACHTKAEWAALDVEKDDSAQRRALERGRFTTSGLR